MIEEAIVREIREIREAHAAKFNFGLAAIYADLKNKEEKCGHPVVHFPPKMLVKKTGS
jgi:hypothetical protein